MMKQIEFIWNSGRYHFGDTYPTLLLITEWDRWLYYKHQLFYRTAFSDVYDKTNLVQWTIKMKILEGFH